MSTCIRSLKPVIGDAVNTLAFMLPDPRQVTIFLGMSWFGYFLLLDMTTPSDYIKVYLVQKKKKPPLTSFWVALSKVI